MREQYNEVEITKIWRKRLKDQLENLSSVEFQREAWVDQPTLKIWWDWADAICGYFDDLLLTERQNEGLYWHVGRGDLSEEEAKLIKPFSDAFSRYLDKAPNYPSIEEYKKILADPEWIKITEMAKAILSKIDFDKVPR